MNKKQINKLHRQFITTANRLIRTEGEISEALYNHIYDALLIIDEDIRDVDVSAAAEAESKKEKRLAKRKARKEAKAAKKAEAEETTEEVVAAEAIEHVWTPNLEG